MVFDFVAKLKTIDRGRSLSLRQGLTFGICQFCVCVKVRIVKIGFWRKVGIRSLRLVKNRHFGGVRIRFWRKGDKKGQKGSKRVIFERSSKEMVKMRPKNRLPPRRRTKGSMEW